MLRYQDILLSHNGRGKNKRTSLEAQGLISDKARKKLTQHSVNPYPKKGRGSIKKVNDRKK